MHNFASIAPDRSKTAAIELFRVWDVDADASYDVKRVWEVWDGFGSTLAAEGRPGLCAVRTLSGIGRLQASRDRLFTLETDTLIVLPYTDLLAWSAAGESWRFYWFEFFAEPIEHLLLTSPVSIATSTAERSAIDTVHRQIRDPSPTTRRAATARFAALLYDWLDQANADQTPRRQDQGINRAIQWMHRHVDRPLTVAQMAEQADLAPRSFASAFEQTTGQTPKRYHLNIRLDAVRAALVVRNITVKDAADRFGFSSQFYLSKLYTKRFGHPPSKAH